MTRKPAAAPAPADATEAPAPAATPAPTACRCGCGEPTKRAEARYVSGHDARHAGQLGRALAAGTITDGELVATLGESNANLTDKARRVAGTIQRKEAEKAARAVAREAAKKAYEAALAAK